MCCKNVVPTYSRLVVLYDVFNCIEIFIFLWHKHDKIVVFQDRWFLTALVSQ